MNRLLPFFAALLTLISAPLTAQEFPELTGRVVDNAQILTPQFEKELEARLAAIETRSGVQMQAVTIDQLSGKKPKLVADALLDRWLEAEKNGGNAAILLLAPNDRTFTVQIRADVEDVEAAKRSLEEEGNAKLLLSQLADLIQPAVVPFFKNKEWAGGLSAAIDAIESEIDTFDLPQNYGADVQ